jgi:hypothetical protein
MSNIIYHIEQLTILTKNMVSESKLEEERKRSTRLAEILHVIVQDYEDKLKPTPYTAEARLALNVYFNGQEFVKAFAPHQDSPHKTLKKLEEENKKLKDDMARKDLATRLWSDIAKDMNPAAKKKPAQKAKPKAKANPATRRAKKK